MGELSDRPAPGRFCKLHPTNLRSAWDISCSKHGKKCNQKLPIQQARDGVELLFQAYIARGALVATADEHKLFFDLMCR